MNPAPELTSPEPLLASAGIAVPDAAHALRCASFAAQLFDDTLQALTLDPADRVLAVAAALFHDAGYLRGSRDHHRKSFDIIRDAAIPGVSADDRLIVACAARYHGRTMPSIEHAGFGEMTTEDQRRTRRISAIVRAATAADASHLGIVTGLEARSEGTGIRLVARATEEPAVERDRLREAAGGFAALTYLPLAVDIVIESDSATR